MIQVQLAGFLAYCKTQLNLSDNTQRAYQQDLASFLKFMSAHCDVDVVTSDWLIAYRQHLQEVIGASPSTIRRRFVTLRCYFNWVTDQDAASLNPFTNLKLDLRVPKRLPRPVDRPTLAKLFNSALPYQEEQTQDMEIEPDGIKPDDVKEINLTSPDDVTRLIVRLLVVTGMRIGEIMRLRAQDVSGGGAQIRVHGKGNRERIVYVTNLRLLTEFKHYWSLRYRAGGPTAELFLNSRGGRLTEAAFRKRLQTLSKQLCIAPHLTPHRFRHSAATLLIEEGVDIRLVQRLLGHASISTTEIYTKVSDTSLIAAIEKADTLGRLER